MKILRKSELNKKERRHNNVESLGWAKKAVGGVLHAKSESRIKQMILHTRTPQYTYSLYW